MRTGKKLKTLENHQEKMTSCVHQKKQAYVRKQIVYPVTKVIRFSEEEVRNVR